MKFLYSPPKTYFFLAMTLISLCLFNLPAFAEQNFPEIKNLNDISDKTFSSYANKTAQPQRIAPFEKNNGIISLESGIKFFPETQTIDLTLRDIDAASVLRILAKEGRRNIVIDQSVVGNISAELKKTSLNDAMQIILTSQELEARLSNGTIYVASRPAMAKKGLNRRCIKTFKLNNANPVEVAQLLEASVFNKGYKVNENTGGSAMAAVDAGADAAQQGQTASSVGQSSLVDSKVIKGKVSQLVSGESFGDASKLASTIKIQQVNSSTQSININNNDGGAIVIPDTRSNSILVAGLEEDIYLVQEALKTLDKALRQVSIEVSLIEVKKENQKDLGMLLNTQRGSISGGFNSVGTKSGYDFSSLANQTGITLNTVNHLSQSEFAAEIKTLVKNKKAKLLANPQILALDDSESLIKITDQVISKVQTTITQNTTTYSTEVADVGIVLNILPKIGDDDYITMRVRPSITDPLPEVTVGDFEDGGAAVRVTPISTREVILQNVRIKSGETLAIAGITKENNVETIGKVPFAAELPVVGKLFQNKEYAHYKTELIILITPKIVDEEMANNSL